MKTERQKDKDRRQKREDRRRETCMSSRETATMRRGRGAQGRDSTDSATFRDRVRSQQTCWCDRTTMCIHKRNIKCLLGESEARARTLLPLGCLRMWRRRRLLWTWTLPLRTALACWCASLYRQCPALLPSLVLLAGGGRQSPARAQGGLDFGWARRKSAFAGRFEYVFRNH